MLSSPLFNGAVIVCMTSPVTVDNSERKDLCTRDYVAPTIEKPPFGSEADSRILVLFKFKYCIKLFIYKMKAMWSR